jgi:hypothetical protein
VRRKRLLDFINAIGVQLPKIACFRSAQVGLAPDKPMHSLLGLLSRANCDGGTDLMKDKRPRK